MPVLDNESMAALLEAFLAESEEGLAAAEEGLLILERWPEDPEALGSVFRAIHTLKGNAGIFEFNAMAQVAHAMETQLDRLRAGEAIVSNVIITALLESVDALRAVLFDPDRRCFLHPGERALIERLEQADEAGEHPLQRGALPMANRSARTLRIDLAKLDRLLDLSGEINIARGRLTALLGDATTSVNVALEAQRDSDHLHLEMQELVMKLRMVPVGATFRQFQRVVRDAARSAGKEADLRIEGDDVEVDVIVVEHLRDPLSHMIRNSIAHGIETPAMRRAAGKPEAGAVLLRSFREGSSIVIEITDDGAGIDCERVILRARERGLIAEKESLSTAQVAELIFHPSFSTAESVTDLSGRGVGLDVVRRNIDALHGSVTVESEAGQGTTFRIRLPLTLAIVDGLGVTAGGESFVIPMEAVIEALQLPSTATHSGSTGVITHRGESIPFLRLSDRLSINAAASERQNVVVVRYAHGRAGLVVDALQGECHTVVKPLPKSLRGIRGLSGSAILPSGRIAFIVDVPGLLQVEIDRRRLLTASSNRSHQEWSCSAN